MSLFSKFPASLTAESSHSLDVDSAKVDSELTRREDASQVCQDVLFIIKMELVNNAKIPSISSTKEDVL